MTKRMTRLEALEYCSHGCFGLGYTQCELQFIWEGSGAPIGEIMALGFGRSEAMKLWNARKSPPIDENEIQRMNEVRRIMQEPIPGFEEFMEWDNVS